MLKNLVRITVLVAITAAAATSWVYGPSRAAEQVVRLASEGQFEELSELIVELKREYPNHEAASVLMEAHIPYEYLIQVMDIVRAIEVPTGVGEEVELYALFSEISVGDAP